MSNVNSSGQNNNLRPNLNSTPQQSWLKPIFVTNVEYKLQQQPKWFSTLRKEGAGGGAGILTITCHSLLLYRVQSSSHDHSSPEEQTEVIFQSLLPMVKEVSQEGSEVLLQCGSEEIYRYMPRNRSPSWSQNSHDQLFSEDTSEFEVLIPHGIRELTIKFSTPHKCDEAMNILKNQKLYFRQACTWLSRGMPLSTLIEPVLVTCFYDGKETVRRVLSSWMGSRWVDAPFALPSHWNQILENKQINSSSSSPYVYRVYVRTPLGACMATIDVNTCEPLRKEMVQRIMPDGFLESEVIEDIAAIRTDSKATRNSTLSYYFDNDHNQIRVLLHCSVKKVAANLDAINQLEKVERKLGLQQDQEQKPFRKLVIPRVQKASSGNYFSMLKISQIQMIFILILILSVTVTLSKISSQRGLFGLLFSDLNAGDLSALGGILLGLFGLLQIQFVNEEIQEQKEKISPRITSPRIPRRNGMGDYFRTQINFSKRQFSSQEVMYVLRLVDAEILRGIPQEYEEEIVSDIGQSSRSLENGLYVQNSQTIVSTSIPQVGEGEGVGGDDEEQEVMVEGNPSSPRATKSEPDLTILSRKAEQNNQDIPQLFDNEPGWMTPDIKQRYIEGCNNNIPQAKRRLEITWDFRKKYEVDNILKRTQPYFQLLKDSFPHGVLCTSKSNRIVYLIKFGPMKYAYDRMVEQGITNEEGMLHMTFVWEYLYTVQDSDPLPKGKGISILDLKGLGLFDILGRVVEYAKICMRVTSEHYPERLYRAYVINVPGFFGALWTLVSPILDENTVRRIKVLSRTSDITKQLLEEIDENDLPVEYGGKSTRPLYDSKWEKEVFAKVSDLAKLNNPLKLK